VQTSKSILTGCLTVFVLMCLTAFGWADQLYGGSDPTLWSFQRSLAGMPGPGMGVASPARVTDRGILASDLVKGNGTRAGYMLSHGGIVPNSEVVTVDGIVQYPGRDYYLDVTSGMLAFAAPVRLHQSIRVNYRYVAEQDANRRTMNLPGLNFNIGRDSQMGILYAYQADAVESGKVAFDILTYGLGLTTNLGGKSTMSNMLFFSSPKESGRVSLDRFGQEQRNVSAQKPTADRLFLHNSDISLGKFFVKPTFQEVGGNFAGFTALRQQSGMSQEFVDRLEKEKGLRRFGMQMGYADLVAVGFNEIKEGHEKITRQSISLSSPTVKVAGSLQEIGEGFTRFKDLAETERDQWAKEKGITRTDISFSFAPLGHMPKDSLWNSFDKRRISDKSGALVLDSINFASRNFGITVARTKVDAGFARLADLTEGDRADIALRIRREFDPLASIANLTPEEKQHTLQNVGIDRQNLRVTANIADACAALSFLNIKDSTGGLTRRSLSLKGKSYSIAALTQQIDKSFTRLSTLAPVERANFGNEYGMQRTNLAGEFVLNPGLVLKTSYSEVDSDEGGITRYGIDLTGKNFWVRGNSRNISPTFNRAMDLADSDKQQLAREQGFKSYDWVGHYEPTKRLALDSSFLDMKHATDGRSRRRLFNNVVLTPSDGLRLTLLRDDDKVNMGGSPSRLLRQMFRLDDQVGTLCVNAIYDTSATNSETGDESKVTTRAFHFNTIPGRSMAVTGDWKNIERTGGKFEDTQTLKLDTVIGKTLNFKGLHTATKTESGEALAQEYSLAGKLPGGFNLAAKFGESLYNGSTLGKTRDLELSPEAARDLGPFKSARWSIAFGEVRKSDKIETQRKSLRFNASVLSHQFSAEYLGQVLKDGQTPIVRSFSLSSLPDPARRIHYALLYKVRDPGAGPSTLIRQYKADARLDADTKLEYSYFTYRELPNGLLEAVGGEHLRLTSKLNRRLSVLCDYDLAENYVQATSKRTLSLGFSGKVSALEVFEASYGYERVETPSGKSSARTYNIKYDYELDPEHFLALTGRYTDRSGAQPPGTPSDDVTVTLDFRSVWN